MITRYENMNEGRSSVRTTKIDDLHYLCQLFDWDFLQFSNRNSGEKHYVHIFLYLIKINYLLRVGDEKSISNNQGNVLYIPYYVEYDRRTISREIKLNMYIHTWKA